MLDRDELKGFEETVEERARSGVPLDEYLHAVTVGEATAGKNPAAHAGKIYSVLSHRLARLVHARCPALREVYNAVQPEVSAFYAGIALDERLYNALREFAKTCRHSPNMRASSSNRRLRRPTSSSVCSKSLNSVPHNS